MDTLSSKIDIFLDTEEHYSNLKNIMDNKNKRVYIDLPRRAIFKVNNC